MSHYIFNEQYDTTKNIYSLWMTKDLVMNNEMLLMDSDILFDKKILELLIEFRIFQLSCIKIRS